MTIFEIAAQAGTTVDEVLDDYGNMVYDLASATFIGQAQLALGMPDGQVLVDNAASVLADVSEFLGIEIEELGPVETGAPTSVYQAARAYLKEGAKTVATAAKGSANGVIKAIIAIGLTSASYMWITEHLQVRLAEVDLRKEVASKAVAKITAERAGELVGQLASPAPFAIPWWGWLALAAGGYAAYSYYGKGRR